MANKTIRIPNYSLGEELFNSISHGIGAQLSVAGLVLMILKAHGLLSEIVVTLFGSTMIILYTISCIYHALSPKTKAKKILRVMDHCNVFLLVYGTYIPASILGVGGKLGIGLFIFVTIVTIVGITLTIIDIDKYQLFEVICHLINGWSIIFGVPKLMESVGKIGLLYFVLGGVMYTIGSILYGVGARKKYMHCVFHIFCLFGTFFHFWGIYMYLI